jgi:rhamnulose-1-phosphate aldolase/alcohol dehydrogenase
VKNRWAGGAPEGADELDQIVALSNRVGLETSLVQPGGGNTSIKVRREDADGRMEERLLVKGSGTDLRSIGRAGFTRLSMQGLSRLRERGDMSDQHMMEFMRDCMCDARDPLPSVETPLHSILPYRVIVHTHDVATMSLTNLSDDLAEKLVRELFEGEIFYVPYARPGFPLAQSVLELAPRIPEQAIGLTLAHHGLVVWGDDARECYERLLGTVEKVEAYLTAAKKGRRTLGAVRVAAASPELRRERAELLLPVIRGALGKPDRVVLHFDDAPEILERLAAERFRELSQRGMATPEHILRAGRLPLWVELDLDRSEPELLERAGDQLREGRARYEEYHARHAAPGEEPVEDWAKVVLVPGVGMVTAFKDKKSAHTANVCYRATMDAIENAEAVGEFRFVPEADVFEFEHWPLERRKVEESIARERTQQLLPRHVTLVIGGASGIGEAAARRFVEEGANVVVADLDGERAEAVAAALAADHPGRSLGLGVDVRDETSLAAVFGRTVLEYGGLDCLFYTAGAAPRFAPILDIRREDLQQQLEVHYLGAVFAVRNAARIMQRQGLGGSIVCSVSKAAVSAGREAVAYGGSKAALQQALRVAALELGPHGIRVNAINADQVDTPLFRRFVEERARSRGISVEQQLAVYRERNAMGASLIPAREVAEIAVLLASSRFRYTTGDILTVDGGLPDAFPR